MDNADTRAAKMYYHPRYNIPLMPNEMAALAAPLLAHLERGMEKSPFDHLELCWDVMAFPLAPFHQVFRDWLADLDERGVGITPHLRAIDRARACRLLAREGAQRLSWKRVETDFLPQLETEHPLVVAAMAKFLGDIDADPKDRFNRSTPWPLEQVLGHIATLPKHRRIAAGGFLDGLGGGDDPFMVLQNDLPTFDLNDWTLRIFDEPGPELF